MCRGALPVDSVRLGLERPSLRPQRRRAPLQRCVCAPACRRTIAPQRRRVEQPELLRLQRSRGAAPALRTVLKAL